MGRSLASYFKVKQLIGPEELSNRLWNTVRPDATDDEKVIDRAILIEQYKLYVEMADRISSRRLTANSFFLTLNTAIFAFAGAVWGDGSTEAGWRLAVPAFVLVAQCLTWFWTIRSYRQMNTAKWAVVGAMEKRLPAAPYSDAEWYAVGEGKDPALYWPVTHVETWIPLLFAVAYITGYVALIL